jgi:excisionase family DNA binding protein
MTSRATICDGLCYYVTTGDNPNMENPTRKAPMERRVYTVKAVMEITGHSRNTIKGWMKSGRLPGKKVGNLWFIPADALDAFLGLKDAA